MSEKKVSEELGRKLKREIRGKETIQRGKREKRESTEKSEKRK